MIRPWKPRYIFISSTFLDMKAERDHLVDEVFPRLAEKLMEHSQHLQAIDLRRVTDVEGAEGEAAQERQILKVCLEEIRLSHPFTVVLVGHRYGWVPSAERLEATVREAGIELEASGLSVTALEIEFGLHPHEDQDSRILFFLRDALPFEEMSTELAARFSSAHDPTAVAEGHHIRIGELRKRLKRKFPDQCFPYSATWDSDKNQVVDLRDWGDMVFREVWAAMEPLILEEETEEKDEALEKETRTLAVFLERHRRDFRGRETLVKDLVELAADGEASAISGGVCVVGGPGTGKSALFVHLYGVLGKREDLILLAHAAGCSGRSTQAADVLATWSEILRLELGLNGPGNIGASSDEIRETFANLLRLAAVDRRVVILLDALDQLDPMPGGKTWFPDPWPANVRLVATSRPDHVWMHVADRERLEVRDLSPLEAEEAERIIEAINLRRREKIAPEVLQALVMKSEEGSSPAVASPLWLTLALDWLHLLDSDDLDRVGEYDESSTQKALLRLMLDEIEDMPATVPGLYGWLLRRLAKIHSAEWVKAVGCLITLGRGGWRDRDLEKLVPRFTGLSWDPLRFAGIRRSFRQHVGRHGVELRLDFVHSQMREMVTGSYLQDPQIVKEYHEVISDYLLSLASNDVLRIEELTHHLLSCGKDEEALAEWAGMETGAPVSHASESFAERIRKTEVQDTGKGAEWLTGLLDRRFNRDERMDALVGHVLGPLWSDLVGFVADTSLKVLLESLRAMAVKMTETDSSQLIWYQLGIRIEKRMGNLLYDMGDLWEVERARRNQIFLAEQVCNTSELTEQSVEDLGQAHFDKGLFLAGTGRQVDAKDCYLEANRFFTLQCREFTDSGRGYGNNARTFLELGRLFSGFGKSKESGEILTIACDQCEILFKKYLRNQDWIALGIKCLLNLAEVLADQGKDGEARERYSQAHTIADGLTAREPAAPGWIVDRITCNLELASLAIRQGLWVSDKDISRIRRDIERLRTIAPGHSRSARAIAGALSRIGNWQLSVGESGAARESYQQSLDLIREAFSLHTQSQLWIHHTVGILHQKLGNVDQFEELYKDAMARYRSALEFAFWIQFSDPSEVDYLRGVAVVHTKMGETLEKMGEYESALEAFSCAYVISWVLGELDPASKLYVDDVYICTENVSRLATLTGNSVETVEQAKEREGSRLSRVLEAIKGAHIKAAIRDGEGYWETLKDLVGGGNEANSQLDEVNQRQARDMLTRILIGSNKLEENKTIALLGQAPDRFDRKLVDAISKILAERKREEEEVPTIVSPINDPAWNDILISLAELSRLELIPALPGDAEKIRGSLDDIAEQAIFDALQSMGGEPKVAKGIGEDGALIRAMHAEILDSCGELVVVWDGNHDTDPGSIAAAVEMARDRQMPTTWISLDDPDRVVRE